MACPPLEVSDLVAAIVRRRRRRRGRIARAIGRFAARDGWLDGVGGRIGVCTENSIQRRRGERTR